VTNTLEFVGIVLLAVSLLVLSLVAGAAPALNLPPRVMITIYLDAAIGFTLGSLLSVVAMRRQGIKLRGAVAVIMGLMLMIIAAFYVPTWLLLTYLPALPGAR